MFGGALAAAVIPLGALALSKRDPEEGWVPGKVDVDFSYNVNMGLEEFEERILNPAMRRMAEQFDTFMIPELKELLK